MRVSSGFPWACVFSQSPDGLLWETVPAAGTTTTAAGSTTAATSTDAATTPAAAGTTTAPTKFSYDEDRSAWIPPTKVKAIEAATNRTASELARLQAALAERERQIAALTNQPPQDPQTVEAEKVKAAFFEMFPHLKDLDADTIKAIKDMRARQGEITEATQHVWDQHTERFLSTLDSRVADKIGADKLTAKQQKAVRAAFGVMAVPDQETEPEAFAEFDRRYRAGDETLIDDFIKQYDAEVLEPARRQALVPAAARRAVPRSGGTAPVTTTEKPKNINYGNLDEVFDAISKDPRMAASR